MKFVMVPSEPTEEMLIAFIDMWEPQFANSEMAEGCYQAMLAAAPEQPAPQPLLSNMDRAVLTMPVDQAMSDDLSRIQFYDRVQWLIERIDEQQATPELPAQAAQPDALHEEAMQMAVTLTSASYLHRQTLERAETIIRQLVSECDAMQVMRDNAEGLGVELMREKTDAVAVIRQLAEALDAAQNGLQWHRPDPIRESDANADANTDERIASALAAAAPFIDGRKG